MFGLREQVGRNEGRIGAFVGDHEHLGGARGHVDGGAVGTAAHLTLGLGHVGVAGPKILPTRGIVAVPKAIAATAWAPPT